MSSIPSTSDVTVAMIAAAISIVEKSGAADYKERVRKFKEVYKEIWQVVQYPQQQG